MINKIKVLNYKVVETIKLILGTYIKENSQIEISCFNNEDDLIHLARIMDFQLCKKTEEKSVFRGVGRNIIFDEIFSDKIEKPIKFETFYIGRNILIKNHGKNIEIYYFAKENINYILTIFDEQEVSYEFEDVNFF